MSRRIDIFWMSERAGRKVRRLFESATIVKQVAGSAEIKSSLI